MLKRFNSFRISSAVLVLGMCLSACAAPREAPVVTQHHPKTTKTIASSNTSSGSEDKAAGKGASLSNLEAAYKRNSDDPTAALNYAQALRENGRLQRAAIVLDPFIQDNQSDNAAMVAEYGSIQAAMGNYADAEKYARQAIASDPKSGPGYHVLGIALDAEGQHDQAETAFRNALDNWQGNPSPVLNNLGLNLAAQGFLDEAVATLRKAASLDPDRTEIKRNLRIVLALQSQSPPEKQAPVPKAKPKT